MITDARFVEQRRRRDGLGLMMTVIAMETQSFPVVTKKPAGRWKLEFLVIGWTTIRLKLLEKGKRNTNEHKRGSVLMLGFFIFKEGDGVLAYRATVEEAEEYAEFLRVTEPDSEFTVKRITT